MGSFQSVDLAFFCTRTLTSAAWQVLWLFTRGHQDSQPDVEGSAASARSWRSVLILVVMLVSSFRWLACWCRSLQRETRPAGRTVHHSRSPPQPTMGWDCAPSRTGLELAGVVGAGPQSRAIVGCTQLDPLEMAHPAVAGAGSGDFERWDHCSQITSEGLNRPRLVSVVLAPQAPIAEKVRNRDLLTDADLAAVAYERSNPGDEIL